jgi:hypothetical protein
MIRGTIVRASGPWLVLALSWTGFGCNGLPSSHETSGESSDAESLQRGQHEQALMPEEPVYLQKHSIRDLGGSAIRLSNGDELRPGVAAQKSLDRHHQIDADLRLGANAIYGGFQTTEEFIETADAMVLEAKTKFVVRDPIALKQLSPRFSRFHFGEGARPQLSQLNQTERAWFDRFKRQMLLKPADHPLGDAARRGDAALLTAALDGKGDMTVTTRVRMPKGGLKMAGSSILAPTLKGKTFDFSANEPRPSTIGSILSPGMDEEESGGWTFHSESGSKTGVSQFVNGFTIADAFDWSEEWNFGIGSLEVGAGAWYGVGLRIPIQVTGSISPSEIWQFGGDRDLPSVFETELKVDVIDADESFYEKSGMAPIDIQEGKELVLNAGAYVHVDVELMGVLNTDVTLPANGAFDEGRDFRPPFDNCGTSCGLDFWLPSSLTKTGLDIAGIVTGEARVGFNVSGEGEVELDYESLYDGEVVPSSRGSSERETHQLSFTDTDERLIDTELSALESLGEKSFGYRISNVDYAWTVGITPGVRGDIHVNALFFQFDEVIGPFWLDFAEVTLGTVQFDHHAGTRSSHDVEKGVKKWTAFTSHANQNGFDPSADTDHFTFPPEETEDGYCLPNGFCQATPISSSDTMTFTDGVVRNIQSVPPPTIGEEELPRP